MGMDALLYIVVISCVVPIAVTDSKCGYSQFIDKNGKCTDCSVCKNDSWVKTKCTQKKDTVCESLKSFLSKVNWEAFNSRWINEQNRNKTTTPSGVDDKSYSQRDNSAALQKNDTEQWKKLTFSLIGVLCVLVIVATVIVFLSCHKFLRFRESKASNHVTAEQGEVEGDYVVIHRRPSGYVPNYSDDSLPPPLSPSSFDNIPTNAARLQQMRRLYRPQRRLLNEYVDDVFESEDSGGSRSGVRGHLHTIIEAPECTDMPRDTVRGIEKANTLDKTESQETTSADEIYRHSIGHAVT